MAENKQQKQNCIVSFPQMKSIGKVLCDSKISRVEMERSEMSKTPLFCKESTPQNILIACANHELLSQLPMPAPRVLGGWWGLSLAVPASFCGVTS